jgi:tRNA pseudouridine55 synthase
VAKRASTGYSFVVGIDKPAGMTSHDVVDVCRRIYGERRIGHTGTLDPAATGALAICIGPATRLDPYLTAHDKEYGFSIVFGSATDTDDAEGQVIRTCSVPDEVRDPVFARAFVERLVGTSKQLPPVYSAVKVDGRRSYEAARSGSIIDLKPRDIEIYEAVLSDIGDGASSSPVWQVRASVSAGTYIRSIARDTGAALGTCAHVGALRRLRSGNLQVCDCVDLESLAADPFGSILDPVKLLGKRFIFADDAQKAAVLSGRILPADGLHLYSYDARVGQDFAMCGCTSGVHPVQEPLFPGEIVGIVAHTTLQALYEYDAERAVLKSRCGFAVGVKRGSDIQSR